MWGRRIHEAEAKVRGSMDEECDNICRLTCFVVSRVLTDWQAALLYVRAYPYAAHVMVRRLSQCQSASVARQGTETAQPCYARDGESATILRCVVHVALPEDGIIETRLWCQDMLVARYAGV